MIKNEIALIKIGFFGSLIIAKNHTKQRLLLIKRRIKIYLVKQRAFYFTCRCIVLVIKGFVRHGYFVSPPVFRC